jgi:hypothetical protein
MILNGFADTDGWLYWCRHRDKPTIVRRPRPAEIFLQNHLYSTLAGSGTKDPSMERARWPRHHPHWSLELSAEAAVSARP